MTVEDACAALGSRALGAMPVTQVSTHSLFAKPASVQPLALTGRPATQRLGSVNASRGSQDGSVTGVSQEPMISPTAKAPAVPATWPVPWTPVWGIASASLVWKVLPAMSVSRYIGIWPKKTPLGVQSASATWREQ